MQIRVIQFLQWISKQEGVPFLNFKFKLMNSTTRQKFRNRLSSRSSEMFIEISELPTSTHGQWTIGHSFNSILWTKQQRIVIDLVSKNIQYKERLNKI